MDRQGFWAIETRHGLPHEEGRAQIERLLATLRSQAEPSLMLFAHGGLIDRNAGVQQALSVDANMWQLRGFERAYFIWHSGFWESILPGLDGFRRDPVAMAIIRATGGWIDDRTSTTVRDQTTGEPRSATPAEIRRRLKTHGEVDAAGQPDEAKIQAELERRLGEIPDFVPLTDAMAAAPAGQSTSAFAGDAALAWSNLAPDVRAAVTARAGPLDGAAVRQAMASNVAIAAVRVIWRFLRGRDHGVQATVVEEVARLLYLDLFGAKVWKNMKDDARDHFATDDGAGSLLLQGLHDIAMSGKDVDLVVIGHSAGCVLALHLLRRALRHSRRIRIRMIFWAPATTHRLCAELLDEPAVERLSRFAMVNLTDRAEKSDDLDGVAYGIYPRSLLYLVSGILEPDRQLFPHADAPLLGMERHRTIPKSRLTSKERNDRKVVEALLKLPKFAHPVWTSPCLPDTNATRHGGLGWDGFTHLTAVRMITGDFQPSPKCPGSG